MALLNCKECGSKISDTAKACPKCGAPATDLRLKFQDSLSLLELVLGLVVSLCTVYVIGVTIFGFLDAECKIYMAAKVGFGDCWTRYFVEHHGWSALKLGVVTWIGHALLALIKK